MYSKSTMSKIRKNNPRRVFRNRMAGYMSSHNKHRSSMSLLCVLALLLSVALLSACMDDATGNGNNNGNGDSNGNGDNTSGTPSDATAVQNAQQNATTDSTITLIWGSPTDTTGYEGVTISAEPTAGSLASPQQLDISEHIFQVTGLTTDTPYRFTIRTRYSARGKENDTLVDPQIITSNPVDRDDDLLIDINTIEQLNNIRHTLDGSGYRDSDSAVPMLCGAQSDTRCDGYELMRNLDFADATSYASGMVDTTLRPNNSDPDAATNSGWDPIGTFGNGFNSRFEGNGYTISNLYGRLSSNTILGFFGATGTNSVIRSVGVAAARLYGSDGFDGIGAVVGNGGGAIVASYASGTINGGAGADSIGGLVGTFSSNSTIVASYASGTVNGGANGSSESIGGLVGTFSSNSTIVASYASGTVNGGADNDIVGGLIGTVSGGIIMASYASGSANGGTGNDNVGGLGGGFILSANIAASYATATADGDVGDSDTVGSISVDGGGVFSTTYGFGSATGENAGLDNSDPRPSDIALVGSGIGGARMLTLNTAGAQWSQAVITDSRITTITTLNAWDFGNNMQAPALRYADYDGHEDTYGCGNDSNATIVIPSVVATPTGPMTITCGVTLLPEQER